MRVLSLVADSFGGPGGIAKYNRDLLSALSRHPAVAEVVVLALLGGDEQVALPPGIRCLPGTAGSRPRFMLQALREARHGAGVLICGHMNLLPAALLPAAITRARLIMPIHGIEAWSPPRNRALRPLLRGVHAFWSVSQFTRIKFMAWSGVRPDRVALLPNCVRLEDYGSGPKPGFLMDRYHLAGRRVMFTLARLEADERYKGLDEVLEIMPRLVKDEPSLTYVIAGDGTDRPRLEDKVERLGLKDRVVFVGRVGEEEKAAHYRMADAFVMPGRGEGFGIVYLEAMACGIPVVASSMDGSAEAVLNGKLGAAVDPDDHDQLCSAILRALRLPKGVPEGLEFYSCKAFEERCHRLLSRALP